MTEHKSTQHAGPDAGAHSYRIATSYPRTRMAESVGTYASIRFRAVCACGWQSDLMPRAGMAHAAHDDHAAPTDR